MGEIAASLGIELTELLTQIVGFLIAVWILKKFAWKPIMGMLEQRREKIKTDLKSAESIKEDAAGILANYQKKMKDIDAMARAKIQEAITDGNKVAGEIRVQARAEAKEIISKAREELSRDIARAKLKLRNDMVNMAIAATEKIIAVELDEEKQRMMVSKFIDEMENINRSANTK
jgi:F-type H+-transporting ATPase subunit b